MLTYIFLDRRHAESAARMCDGEEGTMYAQLGDYVKQLGQQLKV